MDAYEDQCCEAKLVMRCGAQRLLRCAFLTLNVPVETKDRLFFKNNFCFNWTFTRIIFDLSHESFFDPSNESLFDPLHESLLNFRGKQQTKLTKKIYARGIYIEAQSAHLFFFYTSRSDALAPSISRTPLHNHQLMRTLPATFKFQRETANQTHKKNISSSYLYRSPEFPPLFF